MPNYGAAPPVYPCIGGGHQEHSMMYARLMMVLRSALRRAFVLSLVWLILTGAAPGSLAIGIVSVVLALAISVTLRPSAMALHAARLPGFLVFFLLRSLQGGAQVAALALRPRLALQPVMLELDLQLHSESARLFLATTVSLMPGSLACGLDGKRLQLHVLDRRMPAERQVREAEARVAHLFGDA
jgi:multicomponent Na+:H+ antiporter subunit E